MKKLCMLTDNVTSYGGIQRCVCMLSNEFAKRGFDVTILCLNKFNDGVVAFDLSNAVKIEYIKKVSFVNKMLFWWTKLIFKLDKKIGILKNFASLQALIEFKSKYSRNIDLINKVNSRNFDYIIVSGGELILLAGILSNKIKSNLIGWQHSSCVSYFENKDCNWKYHKKLYQQCINKLKYYVVLTNVDKEWFIKNMNYNCSTIYNMLPFVCNEPVNLNSKRFISVGRLVPDKNFDLLIEAFNIFSKENFDWRLIIYGEGPLYEELTLKIEKYNLGNRIQIKKFENNIKSAYLKCSIFITTSKIEGFGLVVLEAMECGLPVISTNIPAFRELIKKENGIVLKENTPECLAEEMIKLSLNAERRIFYSKNNKDYVKCFSSDRVVNDWLKLIEFEEVKSENN